MPELPDLFEHFNNAELLHLLGIYDWLWRKHALHGTACPADARRKLFRLNLAAHQRGLRVA